MKKLLTIFTIATLSTLSAHAERAFTTDPFDPLWLGLKGVVLAETGADIYKSTISVPVRAQWSVVDDFAIEVDVNGQADFNNPNSGVSNLGLNAYYRISEGKMIFDMVGGFRLGRENSRVAMYRDDIYTFGMRIGTVRNKITLSMDVLTNWAFNGNYSYAQLNLVPNVYIRLDEDWKLGAYADVKKDTYNTGQEEVRIGVLAVKQYGATSYMGGAGYAVNEASIYLQARLAVLF
ncbi:MAG: hypothetical protein LBB23_03390 [Rickettsiales bacterium]|nr:hypothetical protein [Rickettsiales bacterium]